MWSLAGPALSPEWDRRDSTGVAGEALQPVMHVQQEQSPCQAVASMHAGCNAWA